MSWSIDVVCRRSNLADRLKQAQESQFWLQADPLEREQATIARHAVVLQSRSFTEEDDPVIAVRITGNRSARTHSDGLPYAHSVTIHVNTFHSLDDPDEMRLVEEEEAHRAYELAAGHAHDELRELV